MFPLEASDLAHVRGGNLPERWSAGPAFVVHDSSPWQAVATNLLTTLQAWQSSVGLSAQPGETPRARLHYLIGPAEPAMPPEAQALWSPWMHHPALGAMAQRLATAWPTDGAQTIEVCAVELPEWHATVMIWCGHGREWLAKVDAFFLGRQPPCDRTASLTLAKNIKRLAKPSATATAQEALAPWQGVLAQAGFQPRSTACAHKVPMRHPHDGLAWLGVAPLAIATTDELPVLILGAGLAGAHVAAALAQRGVNSLVLDQAGEVATQGSGGRAGIFHGSASALKGPHGRLLRAGAMAAFYAHAKAMAAGVEGNAEGLVHVTRADPAGFGRQDTPGEAKRLPMGGWINPRDLVGHLLAHQRINVRLNAPVASLHRRGTAWVALDERGQTLEQAKVVIIATAQGASRLWPQASWPIGMVRGQSEWLAADTPGLIKSPKPLSGDGYAVTLPDGSVVAGATSHPGDLDPAPRATDKAANLSRLNRLTGSCIAPPEELASPNTLHRVSQSLSLDPKLEEKVPPWSARSVSRVAWRASTADRLPIVGAVPTAMGLAAMRQTPRAPGLYALTALGSRGLTLAPWLANVLVASLFGEPLPITASLMRSIDAGRYANRPKRS